MPLVEMRGISKYFGAVKALDKVDFHVEKGEIVGLIGDNGAGKSTLMKILSGVYQPDEGEIFFEGRRVRIKNPAYARALGIEMVYQDLALCPNLEVAKNIFLNYEPTKRFLLFPVIDEITMMKKAEQILSEIDATIPLNVQVKYLSGGQQQAVAVARSLTRTPKLLIFDEPTSNLSQRIINKFQELMLRLRDKGVSIVYISHRLPDVLAVSDRIVALRAGKKISEMKASNVSVEDLVKLIAAG